MAATPAASSSSTSGSTGDALLPSSSWQRCTLQEKGFALPAGAFFRGLLHFYGLEVTHLMPNSIAQIAIFIHLYEGYLGIAPTSICGGLSTASRGTCPMFTGTWWAGLPSRCARGVSTRLRAPRHQQGVDAGLVCGVEPGALPPGAHRPRAGIQGMLGGAADR